MFIKTLNVGNQPPIFPTNIVFGNVEFHSPPNFSYFNAPLTMAEEEWFGCFRGSVVLPQTLDNCSDMYFGSYFNSPVVIPDAVENCANMFCGCNNLNQPFTIPGNVEDCRGMFYECYNLNSPVNILNGVDNCSRMFCQCINMNAQVTMPDSVTNCVQMFDQCYSYNQNVQLGKAVEYCQVMYRDCLNLCCYGDDVVIPEQATNIGLMFQNCVNFNPNTLYVPDSVNFQHLSSNGSFFITNCYNFQGIVSMPEEVTGAYNGVYGCWQCIGLVTHGGYVNIDYTRFKQNQYYDANTNGMGIFFRDTGNLYTFMGNDGTSTYNLIWNVSKRKVEITSYPTKMRYNDQERIDYSGIVISATKNGVAIRNITDQCIFDPPNGTPLYNEMGHLVNVNIYCFGEALYRNYELSFEVHID